MKVSPGLTLVLIFAVLAGPTSLALAQSPATGMGMPSSTLLVAQLDAGQVVDGSASAATGTSAFVLDPVQHTLTYSLTYRGLQAGGPKSIALANFGKGRNGETIQILCGDGAQPCPSGASATLSGRVDPKQGKALDNHLISEFDSGRMYVFVTGGSGKQEIRGQIGSNDAMVPIANYVANLRPVAGSKGNGIGTAIVSETFLPGGRIAVFYTATVANTSGIPTNAGLTLNKASNRRPFAPAMALPHFELLSAGDDKTGGSFKGVYEVNSARPDAPYVKRLLAANKGEVGLVVTTTGLPGGELYGTLVPVH